MFDKLMKLVGVFSEFARDSVLFLRFNSYSPLVSRSRRDFYRIIIEAHTIEKGLSLRDPRFLFGRDKIRFVMSALTRFDIKESTLPVHMVLGALESYLDFHLKYGVSDGLLEDIEKFLKEWGNTLPKPWRGGVRQYSFDVSSIDGMRGLIESRSSIRTFNGRKVDRDAILKVIALAQNSPSQCNRQASLVHVYQEREVIDKLLALQGGSRGFSESVGNLFVVTSEVCAWGGAGQRNQLYIDGALFSMCLIFACRSMGWGSCPLNLAVTHSVENSVRLLGNIPSGERLIMMIAFGESVDCQTKVAYSPRRVIDEIVTFH